MKEDLIREIPLEHGVTAELHGSILRVKGPQGIVERNFFHPKVTIEIKEGKVSLSIKALKENPWHTAGDRYQKSQEVPGVIIKYNKHGALASIEEGVAGLVHVSEFASPQELRETLELGKTYPFKITLFEPKDQRMTLSYVGPRKKK